MTQLILVKLRGSDDRAADRRNQELHEKQSLNFFWVRFFSSMSLLVDQRDLTAPEVMQTRTGKTRQ